MLDPPRRDATAAPPRAPNAAPANGSNGSSVEGAAATRSAPADPTSVAAILRDLTADDLGDPKRFEPFFHRLRRAGKATNPERQLVSHFALALECRRVGKSPVALFVARIEEGDWSKVKPDDFAAAELALGRRDPDAGVEQTRREEAAERSLGGRLPKDLPPELLDRLHAAEPRTREYQEAMEAIAAWRNEHEPGPRRVDPDAAGISVAAFVDRMRGRKVE